MAKKVFIGIKGKMGYAARKCATDVFNVLQRMNLEGLRGYSFVEAPSKTANEHHELKFINSHERNGVCNTTVQFYIRDGIFLPQNYPSDFYPAPGERKKCYSSAIVVIGENKKLDDKVIDGVVKKIESAIRINSGVIDSKLEMDKVVF